MWPNPQENADLVTFTEKLLNRKLHFLCSDWSRDMLNFDLGEKDLGIGSPPYFVDDISRKMFVMLYCSNWPNFIAWLPLLLEILDNMCTAPFCLSGCGIIIFEINLIFLIIPVFCITKKSTVKLKYLQNKKSF